MAECLAPREVLYQLWSPLAALRGGDIHLVRFSLTSPDVENIHAHAADFARLAENGSQEGALVVRDIGPEHSREHYYALVLTRDSASLRWHWCELTGARERLIDPRGITGWFPDDPLSQGDDPKYVVNIARVVFYAFHPLPGGAVRCLDTDVHASGPFVPVWDAARRAIAAKLRGRGALRPEDAAEASSKRRECPRCGRPFPPRKRSHAIWCSPRCRKVAHAAGFTVLHGQVVPKVRDATPNAGSDAVTDE